MYLGVFLACENTQQFAGKKTRKNENFAAWRIGQGKFSFDRVTVQTQAYQDELFCFYLFTYLLEKQSPSCHAFTPHNNGLVYIKEDKIEL